MPESCPHCHAEISYTPTEAQVLRAACTDCGFVSTVLAEAAEGAPAVRPIAAVPAAPACPTCGSPLTIAEWSARALEARCATCDVVTTYRVAPPRSAERPERPWGRDRPEGRRDDASPRARPCRECGGPLSFTTDEAGMTVGECAQCGNRFTLPPRRSFDRSERGGPGRGFRAGRPSWPRQSRGWGQGDRPAPFRRAGGPPRRFGGPRRRESGDDEEERPRRRRRREEE